MALIATLFFLLVAAAQPGNRSLSQALRPPKPYRKSSGAAQKTVFGPASKSTTPPFRVPNSPYPGPAGGPAQFTSLYTFNTSALSPGQSLTLQTLQGVVAKSQGAKEALFQVGTESQSVWLAGLAQQFSLEVSAAMANNFPALLAHFRQYVAGYVLCDAQSKPDTHLDAAVSLCSALGPSVVAVSVEDVDDVKTSVPGIKQVEDARGMSMVDVLDKFPIGGAFSTRRAVLQKPDLVTDFLSDWAVFGDAFAWYDDTAQLKGDISTAVLKALTGPAAVLGWSSSEGGMVGTLSQNEAYINACDFGSNLATLSSFFVPSFQQNHRARQNGQHQQRTKPWVHGSQTPPKHTVAFMMTDGDNVQWLLNTFFTDSRWFASPDRGKVPLGWTVTPAMTELAPSVLAMIMDNASTVDEFVCGVSGVGYNYPDVLPGDTSVSTFDQLSLEFMQRADQRVVNILSGSDCDPQCTEHFLSASSINNSAPAADGAILYYGNCYVGGNGAVTWTNGKPVVRGRYALWGNSLENPLQSGDDFNTEAELADKLRRLPKDPRNPNSYSLIPVHVWSRNVTSVLNTAALLGNDFFEVVTPEELLQKLSSNVFHDCDSPAGQAKATGSFLKSCVEHGDECGALRGAKCSGPSGDYVNAFFDHTSCSNNEVNNCDGRLMCDCGDCPSTKAQGSFAGSCKNCRDICGVLTDCKCGGVLRTTPDFEYTFCPNHTVANCNGALICQGQPC